MSAATSKPPVRSRKPGGVRARNRAPSAKQVEIAAVSCAAIASTRRGADVLAHPTILRPGARPPRPACSGFDKLSDPAARELEDQLAVFGEREILPAILSPTALPKPVPAVTPAILSSDSSIRSQASAASVVARVPSEDTVER
jgi:hypothetical protein